MYEPAIIIKRVPFQFNPVKQGIDLRDPKVIARLTEMAESQLRMHIVATPGIHTPIRLGLGGWWKEKENWERIEIPFDGISGTLYIKPPLTKQDISEHTVKAAIDLWHEPIMINKTDEGEIVID